MASAIRRHLSGHPEKGLMMQRHWLSLKRKIKSVDCGKTKFSHIAPYPKKFGQAPRNPYAIRIQNMSMKGG